MPTSSHTGEKLAAFTRLNEARLAAGVGAVEQNAQLDAAAQAHATYQVRNYVRGHGEDPNKPWFTGTDYVSRATAQGYTGKPVTEAISYFSPGVEAIDSLLHSVYHLYGVLEPRANQVGLGVDSTTTPAIFSSTSITFGATTANLQPIHTTWHWPIDKQTNVNPRFVPSSESPNPAPDLLVTGTPIMFCGSEGHYAPLEVLRATAQEELTTSSIQIRLLRHASVYIDKAVDAQIVTDGNLTATHRGCVFLLPIAELEPGKTYRVEIEAIQAGNNIGKAWTFSTRDVH